MKRSLLIYCILIFGVGMMLGCSRQPSKPVAHTPTKEEMNSLLKAVEDNNIEQIKDILAQNPNPALADARNTTSFMGQSSTMPLVHLAIMMGHKEAAELLINGGAQVNGQDSTGGTPLHWAARMGEKELVILLLKKGAQVNARDQMSMTPYKTAELMYQVSNSMATGSAKNLGFDLAPKGDTQKFHQDLQEILNILRQYGGTY